MGASASSRHRRLESLFTDTESKGRSSRLTVPVQIQLPRFLQLKGEKFGDTRSNDICFARHPPLSRQRMCAMCLCYSLLGMESGTARDRLLGASPLVFRKPTSPR